jgi:hypothetical protein
LIKPMLNGLPLRQFCRESKLENGRFADLVGR